jgi:hypothetical protein
VNILVVQWFDVVLSPQLKQLTALGIPNQAIQLEPTSIGIEANRSALAVAPPLFVLGTL